MITDMETTLVGHEVRRARGALNLTLAQLSGQTGISTSTLHSLEKGEINYPAKTMLKILADALEPETTYRTLAQLVYDLEPVSA